MVDQQKCQPLTTTDNQPLQINYYDLGFWYLSTAPTIIDYILNE